MKADKVTKQALDTINEMVLSLWQKWLQVLILLSTSYRHGSNDTRIPAVGQ